MERPGSEMSTSGDSTSQEQEESDDDEVTSAKSALMNHFFMLSVTVWGAFWYVLEETMLL